MARRPPAPAPAKPSEGGKRPSREGVETMTKSTRSTTGLRGWQPSRAAISITLMMAAARFELKQQLNPASPPSNLTLHPLRRES